MPNTFGQTTKALTIIALLGTSKPKHGARNRIHAKVFVFWRAFCAVNGREPVNTYAQHALSNFSFGFYPNAKNSRQLVKTDNL